MQAQRRGIWIALALLIAFTIGLPQASAQESGPRIQTETPVIDAGKQLKITGAGFHPGERVGTWVTGPDQTVYSVPAVSSTRSEGTIETVFLIPGNAMGGRWHFTAYGDISKVAAVLAFDVIPNATADTRPPDTAEPTAGPRGTNFRFNVNGFRGEETYSYWFTRPDGTIAYAVPDKRQTNKHGKASFNWTVPVEEMPGLWTVTVQGLKSNRAKAVQFEVQ
jgi:hypothetical protein